MCDLHMNQLAVFFCIFLSAKRTCQRRRVQNKALFVVVCPWLIIFFNDFYYFSSRSGMVNVYVRSSDALFEISQGLLIDGCSEMVNRSELISSSASRRRKRSTDCAATCSSTAAEMKDMCEFDCLTAVESDMESVTQVWNFLNGSWSSSRSYSLLLGKISHDLLGITFSCCFA